MTRSVLSPAPLWRLVLVVAIALAAALAALSPQSAGAQGQPQTTATSKERESVRERLDRWTIEAKSIERRIEEGGLSIQDIGRMRTTLDDQLAGLPEATAIVTAARAPIAAQLEALGDPPPADGEVTAEAPQIAAERLRLNEQLAEQDVLLQRLEQVRARAEGLIDRLGQLRQDLFKAQLLARGPSVLDPGDLAAGIEALVSGLRRILGEMHGRYLQLADNPAELLPALMALLAVAAVPLLLDRLRNVALQRLLAGIDDDTPESRRVAIGVGITLIRAFLPALTVALALGALVVSGLLGTIGMAIVEGLGTAAAAVIGAYALGGAFYAPRAPKLRLSRLDDRRAGSAHRWLMVLAGVVGLDRALVQQADNLGLSVEGLALLNFAVLVLGGIALAQFVRFNRVPRRMLEPVRTEATAEDEEDDAEARSDSGWLGAAAAIIVRATLLLAAVGAPALAAAGYYAGARYAFFPLVFTGAVIGLLLLLYHVVRTVVEQLSSNSGGERSTLDRLKLIPVFVATVLGIAAVPILAMIWGADVNDLSEVWRRIEGGFAIGEVRISPIDILAFLLVLAIGVVLTRQAQGVLKRNVLPLTGLDAGGRDAVAAGAGYVGVIVAGLIAISSTGLDLSNLAIVAGALSVGIGFGLQNIVNNFVSGLILLIERPIKAGDWIQLPAGMGYVKNINVRSTEVETFDRSSMFVPNSQLISDVVINWTHSNLNGRVIAPVKVAYGSDPRKVERLMLEIARAHPLMLRRPAPFVLFRAFGPDGLEFEIRGILRDVNWVLNVQSDLNFEILRRFTEEGIEIPVSQTEISLRQIDRLDGSLSAERRWEPPESGSRHEAPARDPDADGPGDAR